MIQYKVIDNLVEKTEKVDEKLTQRIIGFIKSNCLDSIKNENTPGLNERLEEAFSYMTPELMEKQVNEGYLAYATQD